MNLVEKLDDSFLCPVETYSGHDMPPHITLGNSPINIRYYDFLLVVPQEDLALDLRISFLRIDVLHSESDVVSPGFEVESLQLLRRGRQRPYPDYLVRFIFLALFLYLVTLIL